MPSPVCRDNNCRWYWHLGVYLLLSTCQVNEAAVDISHRLHYLLFAHPPGLYLGPGIYQLQLIKPVTCQSTVLLSNIYCIGSQNGAILVGPNVTTKTTKTNVIYTEQFCHSKATLLCSIIDLYLLLEKQNIREGIETHTHEVYIVTVLLANHTTSDHSGEL